MIKADEAKEIREALLEKERIEYLNRFHLDQIIREAAQQGKCSINIAVPEMEYERFRNSVTRYGFRVNTDASRRSTGTLHEPVILVNVGW
jgi:hypothetical protein